MKTVAPAALALASLGLLCGCATFGPPPLGMAKPPATAKDTAEVRPDRMIVWNAQLDIEVRKVSKAAGEATTLTERHGGHVERKSDSGEKSASLTLRIPSKNFKTVIASLEGLGTVTRRHVAGEDITEGYIDVEARLKNKTVLRDRLKQLLEKAKDVKDILAIEAELNRVQGDIDSMEGRMRSLRGQVDLATIHLNLDRRQILGPLGYLLKGLWWAVEKLFVIRD